MQIFIELMLFSFFCLLEKTNFYFFHVEFDEKNWKKYRGKMLWHIFGSDHKFFCGNSLNFSSRDIFWVLLESMCWKIAVTRLWDIVHKGMSGKTQFCTQKCPSKRVLRLRFWNWYCLWMPPIHFKIFIAYSTISYQVKSGS